MGKTLHVETNTLFIVKQAEPYRAQKRSDDRRKSASHLSRGSLDSPSAAVATTRRSTGACSRVCLRTGARPQRETCTFCGTRKLGAPALSTFVQKSMMGKAGPFSWDHSDLLLARRAACGQKARQSETNTQAVAICATVHPKT